MFRFPAQVEAAAFSIATKIRARTESRQSVALNALPLVLVAVHIRRRDYVHYYGIRVPDMGMIEEAMAYFHDKYLNVCVIIVLVHVLVFVLYVLITFMRLLITL